ncbi:hypothetical protein, partial [Rhizobium oryzihabitans]|uniref:hypothetical protein n=1 Tax=Rhizobium oryzihabitans TaxID=2267833 RepID=UPI004036AD90
ERSANGRILLICFWITSAKNSLFGTSGGNVVIAVAKSIAYLPEKITCCHGFCKYAADIARKSGELHIHDRTSR